MNEVTDYGYHVEYDETFSPIESINQIIEDNPRDSDFREASLKCLFLMTTMIEWVTESHSPQVAAWAVVYAAGLPMAQGVSITDRAAMLEISPAGLSKQIRIFKTLANLPDNPYLFKK